MVKKAELREAMAAPKAPPKPLNMQLANTGTITESGNIPNWVSKIPGSERLSSGDPRSAGLRALATKF
jgi:hypothetical protein